MFKLKSGLGVAVSKSAVEMTKEDYDSQMDPNLWGCFTIAQAAVKYVLALTISQPDPK